MKRLAPLALAFLCLLPAVSYPQGLSFGIGGGGGIGAGGLGVGLGDREIERISGNARQTLKADLIAEYKKECGPKAKKKGEDCDDTKALYEGEALSSKDSFPLPDDYVKGLGFTPPGAEYVQKGFVVYLVRLPRRIIMDSVSLDEKGGSGAASLFNK